MPSNYAHYRFGCLALEAMEAKQSRFVGRFRQLYDVAQHGPDLFFYDNPFWGNEGTRLGKAFHGQTGQEFFTNACAAWKAAPSDAGRVFLYGLLGHYCLDSHCHPYIWQLHNSGAVRHAELETDFDRFLLRKDGRVPPHVQHTGGHIRLTRGECVTAAQFFPEVKPGRVHRCVGNMRLYSKLLAHKNRKALEAVLKLANENVRDHVMHTRANPRCEAIHPELLCCFDRALEKYPAMVAQLDAYLDRGEPLGADFEPKFG